MTLKFRTLVRISLLIYRSVSPSTIPAYACTASDPGTLYFPQVTSVRTFNPSADAIFVSMIVRWAPVSTIQYTNFPFIPILPTYWDISQRSNDLWSLRFSAQSGLGLLGVAVTDPTILSWLTRLENNAPFSLPNREMATSRSRFISCPSLIGTSRSPRVINGPPASGYSPISISLEAIWGWFWSVRPDKACLY
jgi:hypothetical protein